MQTSLPLTRDLVLIGGGHAHALVLLKWAMKPLAGARLTLIDPNPAAPYTGMLPGHVAGHYDRAALEIDLVRLARHAGARLVMAAATGIDRQARRIQIAGQANIAYDVVSVDIGITSSMPDLPGFTEYAHAAKPLGPFADAWEGFVAGVVSGDRPAKAAVIGGGVAGVELALAMAHRLRGAAGAQAEVTLVEREAQVLGEIGARARAALHRHLNRQGIHIRCGQPVTEITGEGLTLADGTGIAAGFVTGAAGSRPHAWLADSGLAHQNGYLSVGASLQSTTDPAVFAVGDCAHLAFAPRPKAGVFAVRAAPVLFDNLRAVLSGGRLRDFRPQRDYLKLISTGGKGAVADKFRLTLDGRYLWRLKNHIDRKFMRQFHDLPGMPVAPLPAVMAFGLRDEIAERAPLCGGCGAKLARGALDAALAGLPSPERADVLIGAGDDAALLVHGAGAQVFTTDHLRAFCDDPFILARIAALHAMGDVWAMGGRPQAALAEIVLPRLGARLAAETLREIMAAAAETFRAEGADVVGGHTSVGADLSVGYALTGLVEGAPITLAGAQPGDVLLLTKPLGSGTVMAAEMRRAARGVWVKAALGHMLTGQGRASSILSGTAHAMTDVTGFGLAGHLLGMLDASGVAARLDLDALPLMEGAADLARQGIRSTIWAANAAAAIRMSGPVQGVAASLLFDPQTSGGLLAAVPAGQAVRLLEELQKAGYPAVKIGEITDGVPQITLLSMRLR